MEVSNLEDIISDFQRKIKCFVTEEALEDKSFLVRWLTAREYNLDEAAKMLQAYFEWRILNQVDQILDWEPPHELREACPYKILGKDDDGHAVVLCPIGQWNLSVVRKHSAAGLKYVDQMFHRVMTHSAQNFGGNPFTLLANAKGFTYELVKVVGLLIEIGRQFEPHYPELLKLCVVVNCPYVFELCWPLIYAATAKRTREKIHLFGTDETVWKQYIANRVPKLILPQAYKFT